MPSIDSDDINAAASRLVDSYIATGVMDDLERTHLPSHGSVVEIIRRIRSVIFPVHLETEPINRGNINGIIQDAVQQIASTLTEQVARAFAYRSQPEMPLDDARNKASIIVREFVGFLPELRLLLREDVEAAKRGDPAAHSHDEIAIAYPAITALLVQRTAHFLYNRKVPIIPRIMTERAHTITGIDIHPGAKIGRFCFLDHGTGIVIGETAEIGDHVRIYQGVTLGALSLVTDEAGRVTTHGKRHPTVENNVTIYGSAIILGGDTIIGENSVIGGNVWITESVPPNTKVFYDQPSGGSVQKPKRRRDTLPNEFTI